jgi:hypothetical protein
MKSCSEGKVAILAVDRLDAGSKVAQKQREPGNSYKS